jgi:hypothetical protein
MASRSLTTLILAMMVLAVIPMPANAGDSGGVQASESSVGISPSNPVEGGSVMITLTLQNTNNFQADDVLYKLYWDGIATNQLITANTVDIPAESTVDIENVKSGLTVGEHKVWITFEYDGGGEQMFYREIIVSGLADLEASSITTSPSSINSGDSVLISTEISNTGSQDAESSRVMFDLGSQNQILNVPSILAGESTWINHSMTAPSAGEHIIQVTVDLDDAVTEADENNLFNQSITVVPRMDLYHVDMMIDVNAGDLEGPWVISGTIARSGGNGITQVPMKLEIKNENGIDLPMPVFDVNVSGSDFTQQPWSFTLEYQFISTLPAGNHQVTVVIDPYNSGSFIQESTDNDRISGYFDKFEVPDVSVDPYAIPSQNVITSGKNIIWEVAVTNSGQIPISGYLEYTWEELTYVSVSKTIQPGDIWIWSETLAAESGAHIAKFDAKWISASNSFDANPFNSNASGEVNVTAPLRLTWSKTSSSLVDSDGESASSPLTAGDEYTVEIKLGAQFTGLVNYSCENELGEVFSIIEVEVTDNPIVTIECTFTASAPYTNINLVPSDPAVSTIMTWNWDSKETGSNVADEAGSMSLQTAGMIAVICLVLIVVLIAAVILTRETEEEVERDIFDYCPACDGELDGAEDRCPSCSFNLKKARKQFHDCGTCSESIPDLLSNCPYCGAHQDISLYFEKRERRVVEKKTIALIDEEEIDPETIHAAGYEGFDEAVKEFGYDSDDLEGHWDDSIAKAEAEVEAAYDRRVAAEEEFELDDEEAMATVTTTLKSIDETFEGHNIDAILDDKDVKAHLDDGSELSASDAEIRSRLFEITGEEGVLPGEEVRVGMGVQDRSLAGNALPEEAMDFSLGEEEDEVNPVAAATAANKRRRGVRRKSKAKTAECGACGADLSADANECSTCGAKFE